MGAKCTGYATGNQGAISRTPGQAHRNIRKHDLAAGLKRLSCEQSKHRL
jgi:hypothetical protein